MDFGPRLRKTMTNRKLIVHICVRFCCKFVRTLAPDWEKAPTGCEFEPSTGPTLGHNIYFLSALDSALQTLQYFHTRLKHELRGNLFDMVSYIRMRVRALVNQYGVTDIRVEQKYLKNGIFMLVTYVGKRRILQKLRLTNDINNVSNDAVSAPWMVIYCSLFVYIF